MLFGIILAYVSVGSVLIPLVLASFNWQNRSFEIRGLSILLLTSLICDASSMLLSRYHINTMPIVNFYLFAQFVILYLLFMRKLEIKNFLRVLLVLFCILCLIDISVFQGPYVLDTFSHIVGNLILMALSLYYFYTLLKELPTTYIHRLPFVWISFAALAYYSGNFFLFLLNNYLLKEAGSIAWMLHNGLNITKNVFFAIALWQAYHNRKLST